MPLFGSRFLTIFRMPSVVKRIVDSNICVFFERTEGRSLFVFIREHCFAKKLLNISAFCLKFVMNLSSCNNGGIQSIFLLFKNFLNIDQQDFGLVVGFDNFIDKRVIVGFRFFD